MAEILQEVGSKELLFEEISIERLQKALSIGVRKAAEAEARIGWAANHLTNWGNKPSESEAASAIARTDKLLKETILIGRVLDLVAPLADDRHWHDEIQARGREVVEQDPHADLIS